MVASADTQRPLARGNRREPATGSPATRGRGALARLGGAVHLSCAVRLSIVVGLVAMSQASGAVEPGPRANERRSSPQPAAAPAASDDGLLNDLDSELLREADSGPTGTRTEDRDRRDEAEPSATPRSQRSFGAGANPLEQVSEQMRSAARAMRRVEAQPAAERMHGEILRDLDALIRQLDQRCQACQSGACQTASSASRAGQQTGQSQRAKQGANARPGRQANAGKESAAKRGDLPGGPNSPAVTADEQQSLLRDAWGNLPIHDREQLLQAPPARFLPKYQLLIEQYFRRLAEEQPE